MEKEVLRDRQARLLSVMKDAGLDCLVVYGTSSYTGNGSNSHAYVRYVSGWTSRFSASMLLVDARGPLTLLVPSAHDALYVAEAFPEIERCLAQSPGQYGTVAREVLEGMGAKRVGLAGVGDIPHSVYRGLTEGAGGFAIEPAEELIDDLRSAKSDAELERHRRAANISDEMLECLTERLKTHRGPAAALVSELEAVGRDRGAEVATCWLATGQPAGRPKYRLEELQAPVVRGDHILVGTYVTYDGYWAHCLRMGCVGAPSQAFEALHEAAVQQHEAGAALIRPGGYAHEIDKAGHDAAEAAIPGSTDFPARFRYGHVMGLNYAEKPSAAFPQPPNWSVTPGHSVPTLEFGPRMVLELHTNLGSEVDFGTIGNVYCVTTAGSEKLTRFPEKLFVCEAM